MCVYIQKTKLKTMNTINRKGTNTRSHCLGGLLPYTIQVKRPCNRWLSARKKQTFHSLTRAYRDISKVSYDRRRSDLLMAPLLVGSEYTYIYIYINGAGSSVNGLTSRWSQNSLLLQNPKFHCRIHKGLWYDPSQTNSLQLTSSKPISLVHILISSSRPETGLRPFESSNYISCIHIRDTHPTEPLTSEDKSELWRCLLRKLFQLLLIRLSIPFASCCVLH